MIASAGAYPWRRTCEANAYYGRLEPRHKYSIDMIEECSVNVVYKGIRDNDMSMSNRVRIIYIPDPKGRPWLRTKS